MQIPNFNFKEVENLKLKTFFINEMLKKNYLASSLFYLSTEHSENLIEKYASDLDEIFAKISKKIKTGDLKEIINVESNQKFKRLN